MAGMLSRSEEKTASCPFFFFFHFTGYLEIRPYVSCPVTPGQDKINASGASFRGYDVRDTMRAEWYSETIGLRNLQIKRSRDTFVSSSGSQMASEARIPNDHDNNNGFASSELTIRIPSTEYLSNYKTASNSIRAARVYLETRLINDHIYLWYFRLVKLYHASMR